jgi:hypothetical protein
MIPVRGAEPRLGELGLGPPVQIAYCVVNAREEATRFANLYGAGPFFLREHADVRDVVYGQRPGVYDHSFAVGCWGSLVVELVQIHCADPPIAPRRSDTTVLHHVAFWVGDEHATSARLEAAGMPLAMSALAGSINFRFHDAIGNLGHLIEIYKPTDALRRIYARLTAATAGWNGAEPVRQRPADW